jgi:hypothetical protein
VEYGACCGSHGRFPHSLPASQQPCCQHWFQCHGVSDTVLRSGLTFRYWFQSLYAALLYAYTPEAFPSMYRGSASGMLSTLGRLAGIVSRWVVIVRLTNQVAPVAAGRVYNGSDSPGVLYLAGGAAWVSMLAIGTYLKCKVATNMTSYLTIRHQGQALVLVCCMTGKRVDVLNCTITILDEPRPRRQDESHVSECHTVLASALCRLS